MELHCPRCSKFYKIEADKSESPFEERTFYLVPIDKSIHGDERTTVLKQCITIPTPNFEDPKVDEVETYKSICAKHKEQL